MACSSWRVRAASPPRCVKRGGGARRPGWPWSGWTPATSGKWSALWYAEDRHVNPAKLGAAFARSARRRGVTLHTGVEVKALLAGHGGAHVETNRGTLVAEHVVVTAGAWASRFEAFLGVTVPVVPAKGQLVATAPAPALLRHSVMGAHGLLQTARGNVISGGTVQFAGFDYQAEAGVRDAIWEEARRLCPALASGSLTHSWARFRPHTPDELPLIGFCGEERRHLVAAGHFKNGLLYPPSPAALWRTCWPTEARRSRWPGWSPGVFRIAEGR